MNEAEIRKYARLMQELGLTGLEVKETLALCASNAQVPHLPPL